MSSFRKSKRRIRADRINMAQAVSDTRDRLRAQGVSEEEARNIANKQGRMMRRRFNTSPAVRTLKHNVAVYGTSAGGALCAIGGVLTPFAPVGTIVGGILVAGGAGVTAAGK